MSKVLLMYPSINAPVPAKSTLLGLGYLASVLRNGGHEVRIIDLVNGFPLNLISWEFDVLGISSMFTEYKHGVRNIIDKIKATDRKVHIIVGGAHASTFPEEMIEYADTVVVGEGEEVICDIVENRRKGIIVAERIRNLDKLPMPAWDLMMEDNKELNRRNTTSPFVMRPPLIHIITSRGCPNNCTFCALKATWGRQWIARSAKNVVDEIEYLYKKGFKEIYFNDDNCSVSKTRIWDICAGILDRNIDIKIACPTGIHIKHLCEPTLAFMKQAGFYRLCFGIETGSQEMQKRIKKNLDLDKAKQVIKDANNLGYWTSATFIFGFPGETNKQKIDTIRFAIDSELDFPVFYNLNPQPHTEIYDECNLHGMIYMKLDIAYKKYLHVKLRSISTYINLFKKIHNWEDFKFTIRLLWHARKIVFKGMLTNENILGR